MNSVVSAECVIDTQVSADANNNMSATPAEKCYSLRPRAAQKREEEDSSTEAECWRPRGRSKRRPKQKPPPLSKYRRKTANARERSRMREINEAFESLRRAVPHLHSGNDNHNEKLTKITTLRLAMKYIAALNQVLQEPELESDGESLLSDYTLTPPDYRDHSLTPPTFSEHSLTTDFSDHLLNSKDFSESLTPTDLVELSEHALTSSDFATHCLPASVFTETALNTNDFSDPCLTVPDFDHTAYVFDDPTFNPDFS